MANFPRITEIGVTVRNRNGMYYVSQVELHQALGDRLERFNQLFGIQTTFLDGPYAHDVEAVLERMASGKLIGSQKNPD